MSACPDSGLLVSCWTRPLVVVVPGMGDRRQTYRFLAPQLMAAGYRVDALDPRGQGESSAVARLQPRGPRR